MNRKKIFFFFIALFAAASSFAQTNALKFQPLKFPSFIAFPFYGQLRHTASADVVLFSPGAHTPAAIDPVVHYPAFFCRMELKSVDQLGIWIKIHAGDYDRYSHPDSTH